MTLLDDSVTQAEDDTWGFQCPGVTGDPCHGAVPVLDEAGAPQFVAVVDGAGEPVVGEDGGPVVEVVTVSVPFSSTQWPTRETATARGRQHFDEHKLGREIQQAVKAATLEAVTAAVDAAVASAEDPAAVDQAEVAVQAAAQVDQGAVREQVIQDSEFALMQELHDFRVDQGLVVNDDGSVSVEDL